MPGWANKDQRPPGPPASPSGVRRWRRKCGATAGAGRGFRESRCTLRWPIQMATVTTWAWMRQIDDRKSNWELSAMPELPEVERARKLAESVAGGRTVTRVWCAPDEIVFQRAGPGVVRRSLERKQILAVRRHGKQLWFELEAPPHPLFHFGMSGGFRTPSATPLQLNPNVA